MKTTSQKNKKHTSSKTFTAPHWIRSTKNPTSPISLQYLQRAQNYLTMTAKTMRTICFFFVEHVSCVVPRRPPCSTSLEKKQAHTSRAASNCSSDPSFCLCDRRAQTKANNDSGKTMRRALNGATGPRASFRASKVQHVLLPYSNPPLPPNSLKIYTNTQPQQCYPTSQQKHYG